MRLFDWSDASIKDLNAWAGFIMARKPDFVIGDDYLRRWWVIPRNPGANVYLHEILHSDDDRALHDHPWANTTIVLSGGYIEHTPDGVFERKSGDVVTRPADALHRLVVPDGGRAVIGASVTGGYSEESLREEMEADPEGAEKVRSIMRAALTAALGGDHG